MAFTLGFHIILASLGVALPALMLIANYRGLRRDDADALKLAQRWSKAVAVTFAVGAVAPLAGRFSRYGIRTAPNWSERWFWAWPITWVSSRA